MALSQKHRSVLFDFLVPRVGEATAEALGIEVLARIDAPTEQPSYRAAAEQIDVDAASYANVRRYLSEGRLPPERPVEKACDIVWTLCSLAVHDLLILGRGWGYERYEAWLAAVLTRELLGDEPIPVA